MLMSNESAELEDIFVIISDDLSGYALILLFLVTLCVLRLTFFWLVRRSALAMKFARQASVIAFCGRKSLNRTTAGYSYLRCSRASLTLCPSSLGRHLSSSFQSLYRHLESSGSSL